MATCSCKNHHKVGFSQNSLLSLESPRWITIHVGRNEPGILRNGIIQHKSCLGSMLQGEKSLLDPTTVHWSCYSWGQSLESTPSSAVDLGCLPTASLYKRTNKHALRRACWNLNLSIYQELSLRCQKGSSSDHKDRAKPGPEEPKTKSVPRLFRKGIGQIQHAHLDLHFLLCSTGKALKRELAQGKMFLKCLLLTIMLRELNTYWVGESQKGPPWQERRPPNGQRVVSLSGLTHEWDKATDASFKGFC